MKIIYVYDALCAWCYGFSPVMQNIYEMYNDICEFDVISGGMVTGEDEGQIGNVASYLNESYKDVERKTGIKFGDEFVNGMLKKGKAHFSSYKPSLALTAIKEEQPEETIPFTRELHRMIFQFGIEPHRIDSYRPLARQFGLLPKHFMDKMLSDEIRNLTMEDFLYTQQLGIQNFPTLLAERDDQLYMVTQGYTRMPEITSTLESLLEGEELENKQV